MPRPAREIRILLINESLESPVARMLKVGVDAFNTVLASSRNPPSMSRLRLENITFDQFEATGKTYDPDTTLVFVNVSEDVLSSVITVDTPELPRKRTGRRSVKSDIAPSPNQSRVPCPSLEVAQRLLKSNPKARLFLATPDDPSIFTGADVVAATLVGVAGVIDGQSLVRQPVLQAIIAHQPVGRWNRSLLLIGRHLPHDIIALKGTLERWNSDEGVEEKYYLSCWRASLALAQLLDLSPTFGGGTPYTYARFASALNLHHSKTLFSLAEEDLRRVIGILARWLNEGDEQLDDPELVMLPEFARRAGFPQHPPAIFEVADNVLARQLYHSLQDLEIVRSEEVAGMTTCLVEYAPKKHRRH
jgi:hypothetical protein